MTKAEIATQTMALRTPKGAVQPTFRVIVVAGPDAGKELVVDGASPAKVFVGTGPTSHARLSDPTVSRRHLALSLRDGALGVEDLGSTNGTFLGAARVKDVALAGGEELALGGTRLRVLRLEAGAVLTLAREAGFGRLVGASVAMRRLYPLLRRLAEAEVPVLVEGEPGTGKELLAEVLHEEGPRREGPFVVAEAGLAEEARLFGLIDQARGGTLVVDEPSELSPALQATFARLLEGRVVPREAGPPVSLAGVRTIALSRGDVEREAQAGRLREDLAMALSAALVSLPPLRERGTSPSSRPRSCARRARTIASSRPSRCGASRPTRGPGTCAS